MDQSLAERCILAFSPPGSTEANPRLSRAEGMLALAGHLQNAPPQGSAELKDHEREEKAQQEDVTKKIMAAAILSFLSDEESKRSKSERSQTVYPFLSALFSLSPAFTASLLEQLHIDSRDKEQDRSVWSLLRPLHDPSISSQSAPEPAENATEIEAADAAWLEFLSSGLSAGGKPFHQLLLSTNAEESLADFEEILERKVDALEVTLGGLRGKEEAVFNAVSDSSTLLAIRSAIFALLIRIKLANKAARDAQENTEAGLSINAEAAPLAMQIKRDLEKSQNAQSLQLCEALQSYWTTAMSSSASPARREETVSKLLLPLLELTGLLVIGSGPRQKNALVLPNNRSSDKTGPLLRFLASLTPLIAKSRNALFPSRGNSESAPPSLYDDHLSVSTLGASTGAAGTDMSMLRFDTALQYLLVATLENLVSYPKLLSGEEKQIQRLKKLSLAKQQQQKGAKRASEQGEAAVEQEVEEEEEEEKAEIVDRRVAALVQADIVPLLTAITFVGAQTMSNKVSDSGSIGAGLNTSPTVREHLIRIWHSVLTPQDRVLRGKIAQQGGNRAVLALAASASAGMKDDSGSKGPSNIFSSSSTISAAAAQRNLAIQSLSKLCITANPIILFAPAQLQSATALLCKLWLDAGEGDASADNLQKFEATLALTNVASVGPEYAAKIASAMAPAAAAKTQTGAGAALPPRTTATPTTLREELDSRIMLESNRMLRRAYVELLCNLLVDETTFAYWTGIDQNGHEAADTPDSSQATRMRKVKQRLHLLLAFCAPAPAPATSSADANEQQSQRTTGESSLPTRLAAAGSLATLVAIPPTCAMLLSLKESTLNILARLVHPGTPAAQSSFSSSSTSDGQITDDDRFAEIADDEAGETDDEERTLVEGSGSRTSHEAEEAEEIDEEEESAAEERDVQSSPNGPEHGRASLVLRGVTITNCLAQYVAWVASTSAVGQGDQQGSKAALEDAKRTFTESGLLSAIRKAALDAANNVRNSRAGAASSGVKRRQEVMGMQEEVAKICIDTLKTLKSVGLS